MIFTYQQYLNYWKYEWNIPDQSKYTPMFSYSSDLRAEKTRLFFQARTCKIKWIDRDATENHFQVFFFQNPFLIRLIDR